MTRAASPTLLDPTADNGVKDVQLVPAAAPGESLVLMFERLAKDPAVDVEKLERLIAMQERILAHNAKSAFDAAFAAMQPAIPSIDEKGRIVVDGTTRSTYAKNEDIQDTIRPILARHGFALSFETRWPEKGGIEIVGTLAHVEGYSRSSTFRALADKTGSKNDIQALGSSTSYGRRYTTIDLLNISTREPHRGADDDGQGSEAPPAPEGYEAWMSALEAVASEGWPELSKAWGAKTPNAEGFRKHAQRYDAARWQTCRQKAQAVKVAK